MGQFWKIGSYDNAVLTLLEKAMISDEPVGNHDIHSAVGLNETQLWRFQAVKAGTTTIAFTKTTPTGEVIARYALKIIVR
jgi:predicted secreted protein